MPTATITSKGQITVPKTIRDRLGLSRGDVLEFSIADDGTVRLRRFSPRDEIFGRLHDHAPSEPVTVEEMRAAVRERAAGSPGADAS